MWYGPTQVLPSPLPFLMSTFVSALSFWAPTWSPMTTSFASLWIFSVENPSLCFLRQTESFQTKSKSLVLNAHCSSLCKTLRDHCAYLPLLEYSCNQWPASPICSPVSLCFCSIQHLSLALPPPKPEPLLFLQIVTSSHSPSLSWDETTLILTSWPSGFAREDH